MGFEVELKFRVADPHGLARRLDDRGATPEAAVDHEDVYFAHPARDFAQTGEAFRIRGEGGRNRVTYKGSKRDVAVKTREEIEVEFLAGLDNRADLQRIFERLGFAVVATVRKRRTSYHLDVAGRAMTVTVDDAATLGEFAEVETLVAAEGELAEAQAAVLRLAHDLGLAEPESRSYLRMLLENSGKLSRNPSGQT